jgi:hypothetical protein
LHTLIVRGHDRYSIPIGKAMRVTLQAAADGKVPLRDVKGSTLKLSQHDCNYLHQLSAQAEGQNEIRWWTKPPWSSSLRRLYVNDADFWSWFDDAVGASDPKVQKLDPKLLSAIRDQMKKEQPGRTIQWDGFCDVIRDNCDGWKDHKTRAPKRGFGDRTIKRAVKYLRTRAEK